MRPDSNAKSKTTPQKVAIVVLLSFGLLIAIATQPDSSSDRVTSLAPATANTVPAVTRVVSTGSGPAVESRGKPPVHSYEVTQLTHLPLDRAIRVDLFANPIEATAEQQIEPIKKIEVTAIYGNHADETHSALVAGQIIRAGHQMANGQTVTQILPSGVTIINENASR